MSRASISHRLPPPSKGSAAAADGNGGTPEAAVAELREAVQMVLDAQAKQDCVAIGVG